MILKMLHEYEKFQASKSAIVEVKISSLDLENATALLVSSFSVKLWKDFQIYSTVIL